ncbi:MAG TPA: glycosyltransferase [Solirubrobacteraceae bacterium]|nr:glycosyltransferase [Solirubrobacteraceae bacterium]
MPTLSICIPTHDGRAGVLDRALASATQQLGADLRERIQFCVSDNGSRDSTTAVLERHRANLGEALVTHRFEADAGFTANLLKVVDLAEGDFCWLMGSDDTLEPGALATVMTILDEEPDLTGITVNRINVDDADPPGIMHDDPRVVPANERRQYQAADAVFAELALLQDYISTQIVRRTAWQRAVANLGPEGVAAGRAFPHIPILGAMVIETPRWRWHGEQLVRHRVGVTAVKSTFSLDPADYTIKVTGDRSAIWAAMFGVRSPLYRAAMSSARRTQLSSAMIGHLKLQPGHTLGGDLRLLVAMTRHYWRLGEFWTQSLPALLVPHGFVPVAVRAKNMLRAAAQRRRRGTWDRAT